MRKTRDQGFATESAKIVGSLSTRVAVMPEAADQLDQLAVIEPVEGMREEHQRGQHGHHPRIAEAQSWGVQAVCRGGRPGHVRQSDHVGSRLCRLHFGVAQTPVGGVANSPQGCPVHCADATADAEVAGIANDRFSAKRLAELEVLLEPAGFVGAVQLGIHTTCDDLGGEPTGSTRRQLAVEDEHHLVRPPHVEVVTNQTFEERAAGLRTVEHARIRDLELAKRQVVGVAGLEVFGRKGRRQTMEPAPEEGVHSTGPQSVADALERYWVGTPTEAIVERLKRDAGFVQLALRPTVAVEPQPDWEWSVSVGFPESWTPFRIPQIEVEVIDEHHLPA